MAFKVGPQRVDLPVKERIFSTKERIGLVTGGLFALGTIVVGILAKLDKLGVQLPNGFSQDAALGTSFAPLGFMLLAASGKIAYHYWEKSRPANKQQSYNETYTNGWGIV